MCSFLASVWGAVCMGSPVRVMVKPDPGVTYGRGGQSLALCLGLVTGRSLRFAETPSFALLPGPGAWNTKPQGGGPAGLGERQPPVSPQGTCLLLGPSETEPLLLALPSCPPPLSHPLPQPLIKGTCRSGRGDVGSTSRRKGRPQPSCPSPGALR